MKKSLKTIILAVSLSVSLFINLIFAASTDLSLAKSRTLQAGSNSAGGAEETVQYAHGAAVDNEGNFTFTYEGKTYDTAMERLMAEDGFMYGVDWDWFGSWSDEMSALGDDNILHIESAYRAPYVERALYNMKALGLNCMGTWLGPHGTFTYDDATGLVTGLDDKFIVNLKSLLESCRKTGMYIVPALLSHNYGSHQSYLVIDGLTDQERADWYFRYYYDEEAREALLENGIAPICEILADYQDVIPCVALTIENGSNLNDIETGMTYTNHLGVTWENFATLNNALHDEVKKAMPKMLTSVEDIGGWPDNLFKYNDLKVDIISPQMYTTTGTFWDVETYMTDRSGYLGEFNYSESPDVMFSTSIEYMDAVMQRFYRSAIELGYLGAFCFGWSFGDDGRYSYFTSASTDDYETLRNYVVPVSYIIADSKHEYRGTSGKDVPVLLYNNDSETNYWIGGRNVDHFILERSDNGGEWKVIDSNIDPYEAQIDNGLIKYTDNSIQGGVTYKYRVTSVYQDGESVTSEPGNEMTKFVPVEYFTDSEGNYTGGFEDGAAVGNRQNGIETGYSDGWYVMYGKVGEFRSGEDARTGDYYFYGSVADGTSDKLLYGAQLAYTIKVAENAKHTLSFYSKNSEGMLSVTVHDAETDEQLCWTSYRTTGGEDEWQRNEVQFTSPAHGKVYIKLMTYDNEDTVFYLDDFSVQEAR